MRLNRVFIPFFYILLMIFMVSLSSCIIADSSDQESEASIVGFQFAHLCSYAIIENYSIKITVPDDVDYSSLIPMISLSDKRASILPESGVAQDFTQPVLYQVTSLNGTIKTYVVNVSRYSDDLRIKAFTISGQVSSIIDNDTIKILMPNGSDLANLNAQVVLESKDSIIDPGQNYYFDYSTPVLYTVKNQFGFEKKYTVIIEKYSWKLLTSVPGFMPRDGAGLVSLNDTIFLIGGWEGERGTSSEVWKSSDNGLTWEQLPDAPWIKRHCAGFLVFNGRIFVVSGDGNPDVWSSVDGVSWVLEIADAPWGKRYSPYVGVYNNKIWLMGGLSYWEGESNIHPDVQAYNDVWSSEDGRNWVKVKDHTPWAPRGLIHGFAAIDGAMFIIGGGIKSGTLDSTWSETTSEYNDVWKSTDGLNWIRIVDNAPWRARTHFSVLSTDKYIYISDGSVKTQNALGDSNEVWRSSDGINWEEVRVTPWCGRHASSLVYHNGKVILSCGRLVADVWEFTE